MASANIISTWRIQYTTPEVSPQAVTHLLAVPLQELEPVDVQSRYEWWSEDRTTREVVTVGSGVHDLLATVRQDDQPTELKTMLGYALNNDVTLTIRKSAGGAQYPVKLVAVTGGRDGEIPIVLDRANGGKLRRYECRIHVRRVDGGSLDGLL